MHKLVGWQKTGYRWVGRVVKERGYYIKSYEYNDVFFIHSFSVAGLSVCLAAKLKTL